MNDSLKPNDRREHRRRPMSRGERLQARVARFGGPESRGKVVDLSAGGVMIETLPFLREGDCVWVRLAGPDNPYTVFGEVCRARIRGEESLFAITFDSPRPEVAAIEEPSRSSSTRPWSEHRWPRSSARASRRAVVTSDARRESEGEE